MKICENGIMVEKDIEIDETMTGQDESQVTQIDRVQQLVEGLSTANTITQIRDLARSILDETL